MGPLASIEYSLMDTRESPSSILKWTPQREAGKEEHGVQLCTVCAAGYLHACFANASRIIVGVLAIQSMLASTNGGTGNGARPLEWGHWRPSEHFLINTRESPSNILSSEQKFRTSRETHILSFSMKLARETHILASNLQLHQ